MTLDDIKIGDIYKPAWHDMMGIKTLYLLLTNSCSHFIYYDIIKMKLIKDFGPNPNIIPLLQTEETQCC